MNFITRSPALSVTDVMQTDVYTLGPDTPVEAALDIADGNHVDHMLVVEHEVLAGILSTEDLCQADRSAPVRACMTSPVPCIGPETTVRDAAGIMVEQQLSCLAVVIDALLVGIVTRTGLTEIGFLGLPPTSAAEEEREHCLEPCTACGSTVGVRRGPTTSQLPLCWTCAVQVCFPPVRALA